MEAIAQSDRHIVWREGDRFKITGSDKKVGYVFHLTSGPNAFGMVFRITKSHTLALDVYRYIKNRDLV
jgi:cation transport regulator ChaC